MSYQYLQENHDFKKYIVKMEKDEELSNNLHNKFKAEVDSWAVSSLTTDEIKEKIKVFSRNEENRLQGTNIKNNNSRTFVRVMEKDKFISLFKKIEPNKRDVNPCAITQFLDSTLEGQLKILNNTEIFQNNHIIWSFLGDDPTICPNSFRKTTLSRLALSEEKLQKQVFFCFKPQTTKLYKPTIFDGSTNAIACRWHAGGKTQPESGLKGFPEFVSKGIIINELVDKIKEIR